VTEANLDLKKLYYQIFIVGHGKTELFFLLCICTAFAFYPSNFAGAAAALMLPIIFIRKKSGFFIGFLILLLYLFASNGLLITDIKSYGSGKYNYATTGGTLISTQKLSPGDIVIGRFYDKKYAGQENGRFARGYNIAESDGFKVSLPVIAGLLSYRKKLSDGMFDKTGGELRLTQGIVLGDKKYLETKTTDKYFLTGLGHLLAISGLHVGLYAMVCFFIFSFLPWKLRLIPTGMLLLILILFTGFKVPVMRAGLIGFCTVTAKFFDYETDFRKILLMFAGIFILVSPSMIASPSFLLSFSAVYGLLHLEQIRVHRYFSLIAVGLVATVFIIPSASVLFGSFNISSVITTPVLIPVLSMQIVVFFIYLFVPSLALAPLVLLERIHLGLVDIFADHLSFMFTLYKTQVFWAFMMTVFLFLCIRLRILWMALLLLLIPYIPSHVDDGAYFPNMGRSKGFVVQGEDTSVFYKGTHTEFLYRFLPYLAELGVGRADKGTIDIYGSDNIFIPIKETVEDYGGVCVNSDSPDCEIIYHTRSGTYKCNDNKVHILYKNSCRTENTYLLSETGDLKIEHQSE